MHVYLTILFMSDMRFGCGKVYFIFSKVFNKEGENLIIKDIITGIKTAGFFLLLFCSALIFKLRYILVLAGVLCIILEFTFTFK